MEEKRNEGKKQEHRGEGLKEQLHDVTLVKVKLITCSQLLLTKTTQLHGDTLCHKQSNNSSITINNTIWHLLPVTCLKISSCVLSVWRCSLIPSPRRVDTTFARPV
ncbi:hypothetical protein DPEC_G00075620 [Dallia pectoralis]|uniref:Uncharacterized protein n=1 Tax=Dallia pectoralis TaxID=75939 RepID=A0ACC2H489_DALPE|nr:hypothetical protein DPEC_G00075620 [Dallia pectoralis]